MKNKNLTQKVVSVATILISAFIVLLQVKFLIQNQQFVKLGVAEIEQTWPMYLKLGITLGIGVVAMCLIWTLNLGEFENEKRRKDILISALTFLVINMILVLVFFILEAKPFADKFQIGSDKKVETRSIAYYFYHIKKIILIVICTLFIVYKEINEVRGKSDKLRQANTYMWVSLITFINMMFLMVTILDIHKSENPLFIKNKSLLISGVAISVVGFFTSFGQMFVSFIQQRALSSDKLSHEKLKIANIFFSVFELLLAISSIAVVNVMFNHKAYFSFFFLEYFMIVLLFTIKMVLSFSFSIDERLFAKRKERLDEDEALSETFLPVV